MELRFNKKKITRWHIAIIILILIAISVYPFMILTISWRLIEISSGIRDAEDLARSCGWTAEIINKYNFYMDKRKAMYSSSIPLVRWISASPHRWLVVLSNYISMIFLFIEVYVTIKVLGRIQSLKKIE